MTNNNSSNQDKNPPSISVTESMEYKTLLMQRQILQERISELEEIVKKSMETNPSIGFQKAGDLVIKPALSPITFPADKLAKFFIASRNVKQTVTLKLNNNGVVEGWDIQ